MSSRVSSVSNCIPPKLEPENIDILRDNLTGLSCGQFISIGYQFSKQGCEFRKGSSAKKAKQAKKENNRPNNKKREEATAVVC